MAGSNFDALEKSMMDVVTTQFGYSASWTPSAGGDQQTGMVLFKSPTKKQQVQVADFTGDIYYQMEYRKGVFDGLVAAVQNSHNTEVVTIDSVNYNCRFVKQKYDGDTIVVTLELPE
jgi:hypothetical protein